MSEINLENAAVTIKDGKLTINGIPIEEIKLPDNTIVNKLDKNLVPYSEIEIGKCFRIGEEIFIKCLEICVPMSSVCGRGVKGENNHYKTILHQEVGDWVNNGWLDSNERKTEYGETVPYLFWGSRLTPTSKDVPYSFSYAVVQLNNRIPVEPCEAEVPSMLSFLCDSEYIAKQLKEATDRGMTPYECNEVALIYNP